MRTEFYSVYRHCEGQNRGKKLFARKISKIIAECTCDNIMIGGDFNIHSKYFGATNNEQTIDDEFQGIVQNCSPGFLNDLNPTRFEYRNGNYIKSHIDGTIADLNRNIDTRWKVHKCSNQSDHAIISIKLNIKRSNVGNRYNKSDKARKQWTFNTKKIIKTENWLERFQDTTTKHLYYKNLLNDHI